MVANLAAGRVLVCVAKDGIILAITENRIEAGSLQPVVVLLSARRVAILLGAVEWTEPVSGREPVRLDRELPRLLSEIAGPKRLREDEAGDIENLGTALLEPLRAAAGRLHHKVELPPEEPLVEMVVVGYAEGYGPEVWSMKYRLAQDPLRGDYWQTRVLRPFFNQLYPPEKGQPRTLMEIRYPPEDPAPALLELLRENDPRLAKVRAADEAVSSAAQMLLKGESHKAPAKTIATLVRSALPAQAPPDAVLAIGVISEQRGFEWIIAPPEPPPQAREEPRAPGAPSLRKKPPQ